MAGLIISTPFDLVNEALLIAGVGADGQTPSTNQVNQGFRFLNGMISTWKSDRWLAWAEVDVSVLATGAETYTIGIAQQFNTPRPDKIMAAYARLLPVTNGQPLDRPLKVIKSHETYSQIALKELAAYPSYVFYDSLFPVGNIYVYPVPPAGQFEIHLILKTQIEPFTNPHQVITGLIPDNYIEMMKWNLAARMVPAFQLPDNPGVVSLALETLNAIRAGNLQIPNSKYPRGYPRGGRGTDPWYAGIVTGNTPYGG